MWANVAALIMAWGIKSQEKCFASAVVVSRSPPRAESLNTFGALLSRKGQFAWQGALDAPGGRRKLLVWVRRASCLGLPAAGAWAQNKAGDSSAARPEVLVLLSPVRDPLVSPLDSPPQLGRPYASVRHRLLGLARCAQRLIGWRSWGAPARRAGTSVCLLDYCGACAA